MLSSGEERELDVEIGHLIPKRVSGSVLVTGTVCAWCFALTCMLPAQRGAHGPPPMQACSYPWSVLLAAPPLGREINGIPSERTLAKLEGMPALLLLSLWPSCEKERVGPESDTQPTWRDRNKDRKAPRQTKGRSSGSGEKGIRQRKGPAGSSRERREEREGVRGAETGWDATG